MECVNDFSWLSVQTELRHEKSKSSDLQQRVEELEQSLSGTSLLVRDLIS